MLYEIEMEIGAQTRGKFKKLLWIIFNNFLQKKPASSMGIFTADTGFLKSAQRG